MFFVYILQSQSTGRYYIGYSELPDRRLSEHNSGKVKSTRPYRPWVKVHVEQFATASAAMSREKELKSKKSRDYLQRLIGTTHPH
jgi:putative endonuclease